MLSIFFGVITSWTQDAPSAVKIAQGIQRQNGFELWRLLWREYHPEQTNKSLIWRRTLLAPKFPTREADFSAAFQEWENDVDRYAAEFGAERAIADENKRALLITESPVALKQHLAMHAATLTTYEQVRAVVVSYLQAKRVWIPTATYAAGHTARARDPDAMNVDKSMTRKAKEKENRRKARKEKAKEKATAKKNKKANTAKTQGKTKKGKSAQSAGETIPHKNAGTTRRAKGNKARMARLVKVGGNIQSISDKNMSTAPTSVGPSVSHAGIPAGNGASAKSGIRHVYDRKRVMRIGKKQWQPYKGELLVDTGASVSVCRPESFRQPVDSNDKLALYSVHDTALNCEGSIEPVLLLGKNSRQSAKTKFQVVHGLTDDILSQ